MDGIVISHGDVDHFNVVPALMDRFGVGQICMTAATFQSQDAAVRALAREIGRQQIPVRHVAKGTQLSVSPHGRLSVRLPADGEFHAEDNANSIVLDVHYFGKRILLTGDLEGEGLERMLGSQPLDCDVLMAPHHGSRHSRPADVAEWSQPEWVVVSGGDPERAHEAAAVYQARGARVLHTSRRGAVTATLSADQLDVRQVGGCL